MGCRLGEAREDGWAPSDALGLAGCFHVLTAFSRKSGSMSVDGRGEANHHPCTERPLQLNVDFEHLRMHTEDCDRDGYAYFLSNPKGLLFEPLGSLGSANFLWAFPLPAKSGSASLQKTEKGALSSAPSGSMTFQRSAGCESRVCGAWGRQRTRAGVDPRSGELSMS